MSRLVTDPFPFQWVRFDYYHPPKDGLYLISYKGDDMRAANWNGVVFMDPCGGGHSFNAPMWWMMLLPPDEFQDA